jgi:hypothetical protein
VLQWLTCQLTSVLLALILLHVELSLGLKRRLFYNNESLTLEAMSIRGGGAEKGGIVYVGEDGCV